MLFASITLQGGGLTSVNFVNIPFSIPKGRFLLLSPLLSAGGRPKFAAYWKHQYRAPLSWGSMEFSAFLVFVVWTSSMTYSTFGKGEWHTANHFLSLYSFFHSELSYFPSLFISISLIHNSECTELIKSRFKKSKILNSINMNFKERNLSSLNFFCRY